MISLLPSFSKIILGDWNIFDQKASLKKEYLSFLLYGAKYIFS